MTNTKKQILRAVLEGYKTGKLSQNDVYLVLIEFGMLDLSGAVKLSKVSNEALLKLGKTVVILK